MGYLCIAYSDDQSQSGDDVNKGDIENDTGGIQDQVNVTEDEVQLSQVNNTFQVNWY